VADRALHIGVDGRELLGRPTGVGRYVRQVLEAWLHDPAFPHRLTVFTPEPPADELSSSLGPAVTWSVVPGRGGGTIWEQFHLPRVARSAGLDVFFAGAYTAPYLLTCPIVLMVYDVSYFAHPEWFSTREGLRRRWLTRLSTSHARSVLTSSAFSAREITHHLGVPRARLLVTPAGAPAGPAEIGTGRTGATVLYVGSLFNRRMIPALIAGFARAAADVPAARLVLVGDNRTKPSIDPRAVAAGLGVRDRVEWRDYVTDAELDALYASARAFAFLSTYEGFAMTPLEAIAHGVPPVLLDTDVAHEVYDDAAIFAQPDTTSIARALTTLLRDDDAHAALVRRGQALLGRYSWSRTAAAIQQALERAADA
jgi:glycosyltransferase involved in cell wall biosynthesis